MNITTIFLDIGGVVLTNGWDRALREKTAAHFGLNYAEVDEKHRLMVDAYELGKFTLDEYLKKVIFFEPRSFTIDEFKDFMFNASETLQPMLDLTAQLKEKYKLKVGFVSNEGYELGNDRVKRFNLKKIGDFFLISGFVHLRKPDSDIYQLALDVAQVSPKEVLYIDDRKLYVEIARSFGIYGIHHVNFEITKAEIGKLFS